MNESLGIFLRAAHSLNTYTQYYLYMYNIYRVFIKYCGRTFKLISPPYTTSYLPLFILSCIFSKHSVAGLRYSSSFSVRQRSVTQNIKMGKNVRPELLITLGAPYFQVLCDGLLLYGKTTAISKSRYYA